MSDVQSPITINTNLLVRIARLHQNNPIVSSTVNSFKNIVTKQGYTIKGLLNDRVYNARTVKSLPEGFLKTELYPALNDIVHHYIMYGFAVIRIAESLRYKGIMTLVVVPLTQVNVKVGWNKYNQMVLTAYARAGSDTDVLEYGYVSCVYKPDTFGNLTSPIAQCINRLEFSERIWELYLEAAGTSLHPQLIFGQKEGSSSSSSSTVGMESASLSGQLIRSPMVGGVGNQAAQSDMKRSIAAERSESIREFTNQINPKNAPAARGVIFTDRSILSQEGGYSSQMRRDLYASSAVVGSTNLKELEDRPTITKTPLFPPIGTFLDKQIDISFPPDFVEIQSQIANDLYRVFGFLPPGIAGDSKYASNTDYISEALANQIQNFITNTEPELSACVSLMLTVPLLEEYYYETAEERKRRKEEADVDAMDATPGIKRAIKSGMGQNMTTTVVGEDSQITNTKNGDEDEEEEEEKQPPPRLIVEVEYGFKPRIDFETALAWRDAAVISHKALQDIVIQGNNLPDDSREKQPPEYFLKQRAEIEAEAKAKFAPPPSTSSASQKSKKPKEPAKPAQKQKTPVKKQRTK